MSHTAYPSYRDSETRFLGDVPSHWSTLPLWAMFRRVKRTGYAQEELLSVYRQFGIIPKSSREDNYNKSSEDLSGYQLVMPDDLVINKMKAWQGSVAVSDRKGIVSPAYFVFVPLHNERSRYLHYLFRSDQYIAAYQSISKGIRPNQWDLEPDQHRCLPVLVPPRYEQKIISEFLDCETVRIDTLVEEKKRLIQLLREKFNADQSRAVTQGLNPAVSQCETGIQDIGAIPEHWRLIKAKYLISEFEQGWSPQCENAPARNSSEWAVLKVGAVNNGVFQPDENKRLPEHLEGIPELTVRAQDLLVSRANTRDLVGSAAVADQDYDHLMVCDKLYRIRLNEKVCLPSFLAAYLQTEHPRREIEFEATGASSSMLNIGQSVIREMFVPVPPVDEQREILDWIADHWRRCRELEKSAESSIELLRERRSAAISAAVMGKIDLRSWNHWTPSAEVQVPRMEEEGSFYG